MILPPTYVASPVTTHVQTLEATSSTAKYVAPPVIEDRPKQAPYLVTLSDGVGCDKCPLTVVATPVEQVESLCVPPGYVIHPRQNLVPAPHETHVLTLFLTSGVITKEGRVTHDVQVLRRWHILHPNRYVRNSRRG